jgi:hypothetical protein
LARKNVSHSARRGIHSLYFEALGGSGVHAPWCFALLLAVLKDPAPSRFGVYPRGIRGCLDGKECLTHCFAFPVAPLFVFYAYVISTVH